MSVEYLNGNEFASQYAPSTQVYKATHDGAGNRLPFMYRSFISFTYGGKAIEDFNLIAYTEGDRISRNLYANFDDTTETYDVIDGQFYWGTHYTNNQLTLDLATDGITQKQLDDFKEWFKPGIEKELILAEHPNRAILARVQSPPQMQMLAFEEQTTMKIMGQEYPTSITLYKGTISLSFIMDEPHWYAKFSLLNPYLEGQGANGIINIAEDPERIRDKINEIIQQPYINEGQPPIIVLTYKDNDGVEQKNIMHVHQMVRNTDREWDEEHESRKSQYWKLIVAKDQDRETELTYYYPDDILGIAIGLRPLGDKDYIKIALEDNIPFLPMIKDNVLVGEGLGVDDDSTSESKIYNEETGRGAHILYWGYIARDGADGSGGTITEDDYLYFYYSGTAYSKPVLKFTFIPTFTDDGYINEPRNSYVNKDIVATDDYNYIALDDTKFFKFTIPSLLMGYNQALSTVDNFNGTSFTELLTLLKETINEYYARAWAIFCMQKINSTRADLVDKDSGEILDALSFCEEFKKGMRYLICESDTSAAKPVECMFNSKTGEAAGTFSIRIASTTTDNYSTPDFQMVEENIGDMVRSDYLIIEGRNYPNAEGYITKRECHRLSTNIENGLTDVSLVYQNMYL